MELLKWCRLQWDRVAATLAIAAGGVMLVVGWVKVSGTPFVAEQVPVVVSCGLGGIFLLGVGAMLWNSADLRDQWRKLDRLEEQVAALNAQRGPSPTVCAVDGFHDSADGRVTGATHRS